MTIVIDRNTDGSIKLRGLAGDFLYELNDDNNHVEMAASAATDGEYDIPGTTGSDSVQAWHLKGTDTAISIPTNLTLPLIVPDTARPGDTVTIIPGTYTEPYTDESYSLMLGDVNVTQDATGNVFYIPLDTPETSDLLWTEVAMNSAGSAPAETATCDVLGPPFLSNTTPVVEVDSTTAQFDIDCTQISTYAISSAITGYSQGGALAVGTNSITMTGLTSDLLYTDMVISCSNGNGQSNTVSLSAFTVYSFEISGDLFSQVSYTTGDTTNPLTLTITGAGAPIDGAHVISSTDVLAMEEGPVNKAAPVMTVDEPTTTATATSALWVNNDQFDDPIVEYEWSLDDVIVTDKSVNTFVYDPVNMAGQTLRAVSEARDGSGGAARIAVSAETFLIPVLTDGWDLSDNTDGTLQVDAAPAEEPALTLTDNQDGTLGVS